MSYHPQLFDTTLAPLIRRTLVAGDAVDQSLIANLTGKRVELWRIRVTSTGLAVYYSASGTATTASSSINETEGWSSWYATNDRVLSLLRADAAETVVEIEVIGA